MTAHAQPIVRLADGATVGYEALARVGGADAAPPTCGWRAPTRRAVASSSNCGSSRRSAGWARPPPARRCSSTPAPPPSPTGAPGHCGAASPVRLVMEVTEQEAIGDYAAFKTTLEPWRFDGVRIAVDVGPRRAGAGPAAGRD